ncbi:MAG: hypothetical protein B7Z16_15635 [Algoriphagus sp. 32-45-6]|nr:MAG: hypothetical protein B7Z16_15635 [Algoriphagus sp. 32-45-6]
MSFIFFAVKINFGLLILMFFLVQCTDRVPAESEGIQELRNKELESHSDLQSRLSATVPLTSEQISELFPVVVGVYSRTRLISGKNEGIGISSVESQFNHQKDSSQNVSVEIMDGAGVNGSIFLLSSYDRLKISYEEVSPLEKTKVFTHYGYRGFLREMQQEPILEYELIYGERFRVRFRSYQVKKVDLVKNLAKAF